MMMSRVVVVAGIVLAVAGCGEDGNDANRGWVPAEWSGVADEAPQIEVVAVSETPLDQAHDGHDDGETGASHDDSADAAMDEMDEMPAADHEAESDHDAAESDHESDHDAAESDHDATEPAEDGATIDAAAAETEPDDGYVVEVSMVEFGYVLDRDTVPAGEPVTFRFANEGQIEHEAMFGSVHQQEEFASSDGHGDHGSEGHHGEIAAITLDAENAGEMVMVFEAPGEVLIGCHLPGHWDAGMVASFEVVTA